MTDDEWDDDGDDDSYLGVDLPDGTTLVLVDATDGEGYLVVSVADDESETELARAADYLATLELMAELVHPHHDEFPIQSEDADDLEPAVTFIEDGTVYALVRFGPDRWLELIEDDGTLYDGDAHESPAAYIRSLGDDPTDA